MNPCSASPVSVHAAAAAAAGAVPARLAHLFRASLQQGVVHPLYLPMLQYRAARAAVAA